MRPAHNPIRAATAAPRLATVAPPATKTIPFDYVFKFKLEGVRNNRVQDVVAISVEGHFVGVSLGYSLVPDERRRPRSFEPVADPTEPSGEPVIGAVIVPPGAPPVAVAASASAESLPDITVPHLEVVGSPGAEVALVDLAAQPVASPAAGRLGADGAGSLPVEDPGGGPPKTRRCLQVRDLTNGLVSQTIQLNFPSRNWTPTIGPAPGSGRLPVAGERGPIHVYGVPGSTVELSLLRAGDSAVKVVGKPAAKTLVSETWPAGEAQQGEVGRAEFPVEVPLAVGDLLQVQAKASAMVLPASTFVIPRPRPSTLTLGAIQAGLERIGLDLTHGFRVNPRRAGLLAADLPLDQLSERALDEAFLTGCRSAVDASFLYSIDVVGSGRELQSEPIHNIAGLGIADGDRPFRPFAQPIAFEPRSSVRIQVEELGGPPGTLYIVLQGYKALGTARIPE